ncbi:uncharacterized protein LOC136090542 isoform X2 [Hydra vulgaris]
MLNTIKVLSIVHIKTLKAVSAVILAIAVVSTQEVHLLRWITMENFKSNVITVQKLFKSQYDPKIVGSLWKISIQM